MSFFFSLYLSWRSSTPAHQTTPARHYIAQSFPPPQPQSALLSLPIEIRFAIYEQLFQLSNSGLIERICNDRRHRHPPSVLSILQTCRQVLNEAELIFYAINRFRYNPSTSPSFLRGIGPRRRDAVTSVIVRAPKGADAYDILPQLRAHVPNLRSLYIERELSVRFLNIAEWKGMVQHIRKILAQMEHLEEVTIITPPAKNLVEWELPRQVELDAVDAQMINFRDTPSATTS